MSIPTPSETDLARFWGKVNKSDDCWLWTAGTRDGRYGSFRIGGRAGKNYQAHRVSYMISKGDPGERAVCHSCDIPLCVNPEHLWLGNQGDNIQDRVDKGRNDCKLTPEQVQEIFASHENQYALAGRYGVSQVSISDIKTGRTWNQVTGLPKLRKGKA